MIQIQNCKNSISQLPNSNLNFSCAPVFCHWDEMPSTNMFNIEYSAVSKSKKPVVDHLNLVSFDIPAEPE